MRIFSGLGGLESNWSLKGTWCILDLELVRKKALRVVCWPSLILGITAHMALGWWLAMRLFHPRPVGSFIEESSRVWTLTDLGGSTLAPVVARIQGDCKVPFWVL